MNGTTAVQDRPQAATDGSADLAERLAAWIEAEKITGYYGAAGIAARVVAQVHHSNLTRWLDEDSPYLRDMCSRIKDETDLTLGEWVTENLRHGHLAEDTRGAA